MKLSMKEYLKNRIRSLPMLVSYIGKTRYFYKRYLKNHYLKDYYIHPKVKLSQLATVNNNSFFGYYNISPFNSKDELIFGQVETSHARGSKKEALKLVYQNKDEQIIIGQSQAWNWQQGCMLQWYAESDDTVIYNDYISIKNSYCSILKNIKSGESKKIEKPIYSVANSGKFALTLNFDRLALMRPDYGYFNRNVLWNDLPEDDEDGIWYVDLILDKSKLIISLDQLKNFQPVESMKGARHKVNHIDISPSGKRFMFLHRWIGPQGRFTRLITANSSDGSDLFKIAGDTMVSHNCWWGDNDIISFCNIEDDRDRYVQFVDKKENTKIIGDDVFHHDGHPSVSPNGIWMLTDDYPDRSRFSSLYLYNLENEQNILLGKFFQPLEFIGEKRIDLHPKWNLDGNSISIDSGHSGRRKMYILDISSILSDNKSLRNG